MAHFNTIQIARGLLKNKPNPTYGELFYDREKYTVYVGAKKINAPNELEWRPIGGFGSMTLKGVVNKTSWETIKTTSAEGDSYIASEDIPLVRKEKYNSTFNEFYDKDDFIKKGEIIVFTKHIINDAVNSIVIDGTGTWICVNGVNDASELEVDTKNIETENSNNLQVCLDNLFNKKLEFVGVKKPKLPYTNTITIEGVTVSPIYESLDSYFTNVWEMKAGTVAHFEETDTNSDEVVYIKDESKPEKYYEYVIKRNSLIFKTVKESVDDINLLREISYKILYLGPKSSNDLITSFSGERKSTETYDPVESKSTTGGVTIINNDSEVKTLQQALDVLHQTKADLNAQGKIPLSQIPKTLTGALQYCGSIGFNNPPETISGAVPDDVSSYELSNAQFVDYLVKLKDPTSWEKANEGQNTDLLYNQLDEGDYFIINEIKILTSKYEEDSPNFKLLLSQNLVGNVPDPLGGLTPKVLAKGLIIINGNDEKKVINKGDWVVINRNHENKVYFDVINNSSQVDGINGKTGNISLIGVRRTINNNAFDTITETDVVVSENNIIIQSPKAVLADEELEIGKMLISEPRINSLNQEIPGREVRASEIGAIDHTSTSGTKLTAKNSDGQEITIEFTDSGKILLGEGNAGVLSKFNDKGSLVNSNVKETDTHTMIGQNFHINRNNSAEMFKVKDGPVGAYTEMTYAFDNDNRSSQTSRTNRPDTQKVLLDDSSIIDGGVY